MGRNARICGVLEWRHIGARRIFCLGDGIGEVRRWAADEERANGALVQAAKDRESGDSEKFEVLEPAPAGLLPRAIVDTRWVVASGAVEGEEDVKALPVAKA